MAQKKILTITAWPWTSEAAELLSRAIFRAPCFEVEDYRRIVAEDPGAQLYRVTAAGEIPELVGYVILRVLRFAGGAEGEILAAAGGLRGADLTAELLPALEDIFAGVEWHRITTARPGLKRKLERQGYTVSHWVMRKPAAAASCEGRLPS